MPSPPADPSGPAVRVLTAGAGAVLVEVEDLAQAQELDAWLRAAAPDGLRESVPGARTVLMRIDPDVLDAGRVRELLARADLRRAPAHQTPRGRTVQIPVRYDGPDLEDVARAAGLSTAEVIAAHGAQAWTVAFIGFAPGFPYLVGGDPRLRVARLASPRLRVPAGSVALAGEYCGIYPSASPGGWRLIGRCELSLWDPARSRPSTLEPGDRVLFTPQ